jgi:hypothetical protein
MVENLFKISAKEHYPKSTPRGGANPLASKMIHLEA